MVVVIRVLTCTLRDTYTQGHQDVHECSCDTRGGSTTCTTVSSMARWDIVALLLMMGERSWSTVCHEDSCPNVVQTVTPMISHPSHPVQVFLVGNTHVLDVHAYTHREENTHRATEDLRSHSSSGCSFSVGVSMQE